MGGVALGVVTTYQAGGVVDSGVEGPLLQGADLALPPTDMAASFANEHAAVGDFQELLGGDAAAYFAGQPLPVAHEPIVRHLGPAEPLWITVGAPTSDDRSAALAFLCTCLGAASTAKMSAPVSTPSPR